jgi:ABC-type multidrug transport system fused ATPase/permease subunit
MKKSFSPISINIKLVLLGVAFVIAAATLWYTHIIVKQLQAREKQIVTLYAKSLEYIANSEEVGSDYTFIFENIIKQIDFPLILTDAQNNVNPLSKTEIRNIFVDTTWSPERAKKFIDEYLKKMNETNPPIEVIYQDSIILSRIHYGDSQLVEQLRFYPYIQLIIAAIFILMAYFGFSYVKKSEHGKIWVGLSKETAHQLGTPLSSLLGWLEILKMNYRDSNKVMDTLNEMENDVERLKKIAERFSKIGSIPELKKENVNSIIDRVISYFERRLPKSGRIIEFNFNPMKNYEARLNSELFEWVIENLTKNALDAIEANSGKITYQICETQKDILIDVTDTGRGIDMKLRREVFRPGFSTKKRGWGLGLSLSKRIIEDYHNGKIFVKSSIVGGGSCFRIILKKNKS